MAEALRQEMNDEHRERTHRLLCEVNPAYRAGNIASFNDMLAAYNTVLLKDLLFTVNELLIYKQNEVHK